MTEKTQTYKRFSTAQRVEHLILIVSFTLLAITGLAQKYSTAGISQGIITTLGGIELTRIIHRWASIVFVLQSIYHFVIAGYKIYVQRLEPSMVPRVKDGRDAIQAFLYNLGLRKEAPKMPRYNFMEKMEYWAMIWGLVLMAITGFMLWNPIITARILPGQFIPAAKVAHGLEAVLAVLAIIIWHFYNVHVRQFNRSIFTGSMDRHQMEEEHGEELEQIETGARRTVEVSPKVTRRRATIYWPVALVLAFALVGGIIWLVTVEETATAFAPDPEPNVPVLSTPIPQATEAVSATGEATTAPTIMVTTSFRWSSGINEVFEEKCASCHGAAAMGGIALDNYVSTLNGGVIPNNAEQSPVVIVHREGEHPGMFSEEELQQVIDWINGGAPE